MITELRKQHSFLTAIFTWLIGGIFISEPPSTATWNHVPFLVILGVRFGKSTLHSYQPVSTRKNENIRKMKLIWRIIGDDEEGISVLWTFFSLECTYRFLWSKINSLMLVLSHNYFLVSLCVQCMHLKLSMYHRTKKKLFAPEIKKQRRYSYF